MEEVKLKKRGELRFKIPTKRGTWCPIHLKYDYFKFTT